MPIPPAARRIALAVVASLASLVALEGLASLAILGRDLWAIRPLAEARYSRYDAELGWSQVPGFRKADFYGPGATLTVGPEGARGPKSYAEKRSGTVRILCSGDSFTLGYGVGDDATWCRLLERLSLRIETVNLGQGGYGVDQSYLLYRERGERFVPDIHLLAFIALDFDRMATDAFQGYGKPVLRVRDGRLAIDNVPVPRRPLAPWRFRAARVAGSLRAVEFARRLFDLAPQANRPVPAAGPVDVAEGARALFAELRDLDRRRGVLTVLVFLPRLADRSAASGAAAEPWRRLVREEGERLGLPVVDLIDDLRGLRDEEILPLYFLTDLPGLPSSAGHLTVRGNEVVADWLGRHLLELDAVRARIAPPRDGAVRGD